MSTSNNKWVDEINVGVGSLDFNSDPKDGHGCSRKSKNKGGSKNAGKKQWIPQNPISKSWGNKNNAWGHPNVIQKLGLHGDVGSSNSPLFDDDVKAFESDEEESELDLPDDDSDEDEFLSDDDFDDHSDVKEMSYEAHKSSRWFKKLFESLDNLTVTEIIDPERQWHCAACKGGPGAIVWFAGLHSLVSHTKTKGGSRIKLHRELAQLLEEELRQRGTSVVPPGEVYRQWDGVESEDKLIVWPPMVIIMNTMLEKDDNEKWIGMGNQELRDYFSAYAALKAVRHSYGPRGHRGISVLIFEPTAAGYMEALLLSEHFSIKGRDRDSWERNPVRFYPGGIRRLYGYMAEKPDMENFNQHSHGKARLKFEMKSYNETVRNPLMQMSGDNQQLVWFKRQAAKNHTKSKALEETLTLVSEKHRQTVEENKIVRLKMKMHNEQNNEEMEYQEQFFTEKLTMICDGRTAEEDKFDKIPQEHREIFQHSFANASLIIEDPRVRAEKAANFIKLQDKDMGDFVVEKENLIRAYEERIHKLREEAIALEKKFDLELAKLMEKYSSKQSEQNLGSVPIPYMLDRSLNLQSLRICGLKISVKRIACALCLLRNSPDLIVLDIDEVVKVDETVRHRNKLFAYLSKAEKKLNRALTMIRTVILRKFKGTTIEMYLIKVILAHSSKLEKMIVEQCKKSYVPNVNHHLKELLSYPRASPNAEIKYT